MYDLLNDPCYNLKWSFCMWTVRKQLSIHLIRDTYTIYTEARYSWKLGPFFCPAICNPVVILNINCSPGYPSQNSQIMTIKKEWKLILLDNITSYSCLEHILKIFIVKVKNNSLAAIANNSHFILNIPRLV